MALFESLAEEFENPQLPIRFHYDTLLKPKIVRPHWHENPELLFFVDGQTEVSSDSMRETFVKGEFAFINCSNLHTITAITPESNYYCIIISRDLFEEIGIPVAKTKFKLKINDNRADKIMQNIIVEMMQKLPYYQPEVKSELCKLLILFCREFTDFHAETETETKKKTVVKNALKYMQMHLSETLTVDKISESAGFSKFYFCRIFKEITGSSAIEYLNIIRCRNAQRLLLSGQYNVCESAEKSGYTNLSYFTKCYRRYVGELPSYTIKHT